MMTHINLKVAAQVRGLLTVLCLVAVPAILASAPVFAAADSQTSDAAPLFEQPPAGTPNFTGKWLNPKPGGHLRTAAGAEPPLNAAGKKEYAQHMAALKSGDRKIDPVSSCLMQGIPRLMLAPYPLLILQTTRNVSFVHEVNHTFRIIYWDKAPAAADVDPTYLGSPGAHFEGKALVIDSVGFNDLTWLDYTGLPHGEKLTVQERYVLSDPSTINASVTITDPDFYTAPWTTKFTLKRQPGMNLKENVCMDTHQM
ncbi:MAG TPA: hypothetical protein VHW25_07225 [Steroidobacteraceae bacterium]|nr:hypothetical protein [Steroidobacteraceae bacterium]